MASDSSEGRSGNRSARYRQILWRLSDKARQVREKRSLNSGAALGRKGEDLAHRYLRYAGYRVVARNYRPGQDSEIDIVARDGRQAGLRGSEDSDFSGVWQPRSGNRW